MDIPRSIYNFVLGLIDLGRYPKSFCRPDYLLSFLLPKQGFFV